MVPPYPPPEIDRLSDVLWRHHNPTRVFRMRSQRPDDFGPNALVPNSYCYVIICFADHQVRMMAISLSRDEPFEDTVDTDMGLFKIMWHGARIFEGFKQNLYRQTLLDAFAFRYGSMPQ